MAQAEVTRTGRVLIGAGYAFHHNASNSFGETVIRHIAIARFAAPLPLGLYLAARADLLFAFYRDPVPVAQATDTRRWSAASRSSTSRTRTARACASTCRATSASALRAVVRYTFYANELGASSGIYRRHTLLLSLAFAFENDQAAALTPTLSRKRERGIRSVPSPRQRG